MKPYLFIERPRFAIVISLLITIIGLVAYLGLPIALYPELVPPSVQITASYPGASAETVMETVTSPIEQQVNGAPGMIYMSSTSNSDGSANIIVTFDVGTDIDLAAVEVQNRVQTATNQLPEEVRRQGITVKKSSPNMLLAMTLVSDDPDHDAIFLNNYLAINLRDPIARINGVGEARIMGSRDYGMRIWLKPDRLSVLDISAEEIRKAVSEQNAQIPAGRIGAPPAPPGQVMQFTISTEGRLSTVEQFENIILRVGSEGEVLRLKDVARIELAAQNYDLSTKLNNRPTAMLAIYQSPGANALAVTDEVKATLKDLEQRFPEGMELYVPFDTTDFVKVSIDEVQETLLIAIILVIAVVYLFLQDWRTTVVPALAVPVSLIGTFAMMMALGFSINMLTMFGLVLAIGIVVDDAILVTETCMRIIEEEGATPKEAATKAISEVGSAVIATTLVLLAVFIPVAFVPGLSGRMYNQFALTIAGSVVISSINALTLSPALCSLLLKPPAEKKTLLARGFDKVYEPTKARYSTLINKVVKKVPRWLVLYGSLVALTGFLFQKVPTSFLPEEDQGYFFVSAQLPSGASLQRTEGLLEAMTERTLEIDGVQDVLTVAGFDLLSGGASSSSAMVIVNLKHWDLRTSPDQSIAAIKAKFMQANAGLNDGLLIPLSPPSIPGLGTSGGFEFQLQDLGDGDAQTLMLLSQDFSKQAMAQPELGTVFTSYRADTPELFLNIDRSQAKRLGVDLNNLSTTLASYLGAAYINDFNKYGRVYRVMMQADAPYRVKPEDVLKLKVSGPGGVDIPMETFTSTETRDSAATITRFNGMRSAMLSGGPAPGVASGTALDTMAALAEATLPDTVGFAWSGTAYQELKTGSSALAVLALSFIVVYLFLVAQYESFTIPAGVLLLVPLGLLGAVAAQAVAGLSIDVYTQVGLFLLVGLAAKNAIVIVEFAKSLYEAGAGITEAAAQAATMRFRAILMTSFTFLLGMIPMLTATGAGAASRRSLGTAVFGGMLSATIFSVLLVPVFFVVVQWVRTKLSGGSTEAPATEP